jgi:hypothetical protein
MYLMIDPPGLSSTAEELRSIIADLGKMEQTFEVAGALDTARKVLAARLALDAADAMPATGSTPTTIKGESEMPSSRISPPMGIKKDPSVTPSPMPPRSHKR